MSQISAEQFKKAINHPDKVSDTTKEKALMAAGKKLEASSNKSAAAVGAMKAMGKCALHTAERLGTLGAASAAEGFFGTASVMGVDTRLVGGILLEGTGAYKKLTKPKSSVGDHLMAVGEGLLGSFVATQAVALGQKGKQKWDARGAVAGTAANAAGNAPAVAGQRDVYVTPPAISEDAFAGQETTANAGFTYADAF